MKKILMFFVAAMLVVAFATFGLTPVQADGSIPWEGNGSDNLPCTSGGHWVLAPADGITGAILHVNGSDYTMSQNGNGSWSADSSGALDSNLTASVSFTGDGSDKNHLQLSHCVNQEPQPASASVNLGSCHWVDNTSVSDVAITIDHATLTINGSDYTSTQTIQLPNGSYPWSWVADNGYTGSGSGTLVIDQTCKPDDPSSVKVEVGSCKWNGEQSLTPVTITLHNVKLTLGENIYEESTVISLTRGHYTYTWAATDGSGKTGDGSFDIGSCKPDDPNPPTPTPEPKEAPVTGGNLPSPLFMLWQWILSLFHS